MVPFDVAPATVEPSVSSVKQTNTMASPWYPPQRHSCSFMVDSTPSNSRELRNKAEKQRRDRLNSFIGELATLVPMVSKSAKRMDKTSILRLTATHLRLHQITNGNITSTMKFPKIVDQFILEQLVFEQLGGFLLILLPSGKVIFVSPTVENLLGHLQTDLMGQSLYNITAPEDHDRLRMYLQYEGAVEQDWKQYFSVKLKRAGPRSESAVYETVKMMGMHRHVTRDKPSNSLTSSSSTMSTLSNEIMVFFVKVCRPEPLLDRLIEASKDEYVTRHLIDGRIINCDQRISIVAGYMIEEVSGHSAFKYMHRDDVRWVIIALRQMYDRGESRGSSCFRLQSRNGQFIYLRTFGFLEIDDQGTVESFVCINTLVSEVEGIQLISEMKKRYSAIINKALSASSQIISESLTPPQSNDSTASSVTTPSAAVDLVEDPVQVEQAVAHLMRNLPSPAISDPRSTPSPLYRPPPPYQENQDCTVANGCPPSPTRTTYQMRLNVHPTKRPPPKMEANTSAAVHYPKKAKLSPQESVSPQPIQQTFLQRTKAVKQSNQSIFPHDHRLRENL